MIEIERMISELEQDLDAAARRRASVDDILLQTCRKLVRGPRRASQRREPSEFNARRLDMTRNSLMTTWRQVQSRLCASLSGRLGRQSRRRGAASASLML